MFALASRGAKVSLAGTPALRYRLAFVQHVQGFKTNIFEKKTIKMADTEEDVVVGGRDKFHLLPKAFEGVKQIGVIGWSSQGPAQAQNLRESLEGSGIKVAVGLREGSSSMAKAEQCGFTKADGTLGDMWKVIKESDMVLLLISDAAQAEIYPEVFKSLKPGSTLGLSHGFLLGVMGNHKADFPKEVDVVAVCPKGMGPSVRRLYELGKSVNGSGINASFAVHQDATGKATERALAWATAIGSPYVFPTTLEMEYKSDIFGERCSLLGGMHGIVEFLFRMYRHQGATDHDAFNRACESITGPITQHCSKTGLISVYEALNAEDKKKFEIAYSAAYHPLMEVIMECYEDVASGREIGSVIDHSARFSRYPMGKIDNTHTWKVGEQVRAKRGTVPVPMDPTTAGVYLACMMAQADLLFERGHCYSEVVNESIIEGVDSLNPYLHHKGVAFMIDNCSVTARLGARKWAPRFDYLLEQQAGPKIMEGAAPDPKLIDAFKNHKLHKVMETCGAMRPPVDISLVA
jgi:ketol-acid reductoisomerase